MNGNKNVSDSPSFKAELTADFTNVIRRYQDLHVSYASMETVIDLVVPYEDCMKVVDVLPSGGRFVTYEESDIAWMKPLGLIKSQRRSIFQRGQVVYLDITQGVVKIRSQCLVRKVDASDTRRPQLMLHLQLAVIKESI